jgi:hypothetical protein
LNSRTPRIASLTSDIVSRDPLWDTLMRLQVHLIRASATAGLAVVVGCHSAPGPLVPAAAAPISSDQVAAWVKATVPTDPRLLRFKWLFRDERSSAGGRGSARIAPPDSLRFDVAGPFGSNPAAAAVVADSAIWVRPQDVIKKLVPNYPLMWALLGVARQPDSGAVLRGLTQGQVAMWQYASGADTVEYVRTSESPGKLLAEVRQAGKVVGRVETQFAADGSPASARLTVPSVPARLDLTFLSSARSAPFAPSIWQPPPPKP